MVNSISSDDRFRRELDRVSPHRVPSPALQYSVAALATSVLKSLSIWSFHFEISRPRISNLTVSCVSFLDGVGGAVEDMEVPDKIDKDNGVLEIDERFEGEGEGLIVDVSEENEGSFVE